MHDPHWLIIIILVITGAAAGVIDTLAGGGGLIVVPVMLLLGIPPVHTMGTNKLQACFGELTAAFEFHRQGHIDFRKIWAGLIFVAIGAGCGTLLVQHTHPEFLKKLLPILLCVVLVYTIISPQPSHEDTPPKMSERAYYLIFGLLIGFYNGYFGPGTGSFWMVAFMFFLGFNLRKATMYAKPMNVAGNLVALALFIYGGQIWYWAGISAGVGQVIGAKIGSHLVIHKGNKLIKPVFITVVSIMIVSLLVKHFT